MGCVRRMLRNQCPVGLPGHYKAEKIFADVEMPARLYLGARRASVVRRGNCVCANGSRLRARSQRLCSRERGQGGTQRNYSF